MSSSSLRVSRSRRGFLVTYGLFGVLLVMAFAHDGPAGPLAISAIAVVGILAVLTLPRPPLVLILSIACVTLLTPQIRPAVHIFDFVAIGIGLLAVGVTVTNDRREAWDIHWPGILCAIALLIPLVAYPSTVVAPISYAAAYKNIIVATVVFLSLRRMVKRENSHWLLWVFPLIGSLGALQLLSKVRSLGGRLFMGLDSRNFYTDLGWGASNYIAAILVLCLLGTLVFFFQDRRPLARAFAIGAGFLMFNALVVLFSRAATAGLGIGAIVFVIALGPRRGFIALGVVVAIAVAFFSGPGGRVLLFRFASPTEYSSIYTRFELWETALGRFLSNPLSGIGLNQGRFQQDTMGGEQAHNIILNTLMEQGVFGGVLVVVIMAASIALVARAQFRVPASSSKYLSAACYAFLIGVFANSMAEPTLSGYFGSILFLWFMAWLTLQQPIKEAPEVVPIERPAESPA